MYTSVWKNYHKSVCSFEFYSKRGIRFYRATGFRYRQYIVSDICREEMMRAERVSLRFCPDGTIEPVTVMELHISDLIQCIAGELKNEYSGIKLIRVTPGKSASIPSVIPGNSTSTATGRQVAIIGYSRRMDRPHLKTGVVSSHNMIGGDEYVHIESSFESGNAGSPVIDPVSGYIVGVVTDCLSSQLRDYKILKRIIEDNIRTLGMSNGRSGEGRLDVAQAIEANQYMVKNLARDIHLGLHRGYGFAVPFARITRYMKAVEHDTQIRVKAARQQGS